MILILYIKNTLYNFSNEIIQFYFAIILLLTTQLNAHCQIPCGVYDDAMRVKMIEEHTLTILKSMNYISSNQSDLEKQIKSLDGL